MQWSNNLKWQYSFDQDNSCREWLKLCKFPNMHEIIQQMSIIKCDILTQKCIFLIKITLPLTCSLPDGINTTEHASTNGYMGAEELNV